jgi:hypothetical protein
MNAADGFEQPFLSEVAVFRRQSLATFLGISAKIALEANADLMEFLGCPVGQLKLVEFLAGSDSAFIRANELSVIPHFGVFEHIRRPWIARLVGVLRETGYFYVDGAFRPVLSLSQEADELLRNPDELPLLPHDVLTDPLLGPSCPRSTLDRQLREIRVRLGRLLRRHPRHVIPDDGLRSLASGSAKSREDVEACLPDAVKPHAEAIWNVLKEAAEKPADQAASPPA